MAQPVVIPALGFVTEHIVKMAHAFWMKLSLVKMAVLMADVYVSDAFSVRLLCIVVA